MDYYIKEIFLRYFKVQLLAMRTVMLIAMLVFSFLSPLSLSYVLARYVYRFVMRIFIMAE